MKPEKELVKVKGRIKIIKAQEELEKCKNFSSCLNSSNQVGFTENLSFSCRTANNIQSINQNMNVLQLCDRNSTRVKSSEISEIFAKASPSHSAAVHNLHHDNNRFIEGRITDNTSREIRSRDNEECKEVSELICKLQFQGAPELEIDKFNVIQLEYQYFVSMFSQAVERKG